MKFNKINKTDIKSIKQIDEGFNVYNIDYLGKNMILKNLSSEYKLFEKDFMNNTSLLEYMYNEVLISYLARFNGISCVNPRVVELDGKIGLLEENFNEKGFIPYSGYQIMENYFNYLYENDKLNELNIDFLEEITLDSKKEFIINFMNTLENQIKAINYFFEDFDNKEEFLESLTEELIKRFAFDYITMQTDRTLGNFTILTKGNYFAKFSKMYDNEECFNLNKKYETKCLNYKENNEEILINFLESFNDKYIEVFLNVYDNLDIDNFVRMLARMELEGHSFECNMHRQKILEKYEENYEKIGLIIREYSKRK